VRVQRCLRDRYYVVTPSPIPPCHRRISASRRPPCCTSHTLYSAGNGRWLRVQRVEILAGQHPRLEMRAGGAAGGEAVEVSGASKEIVWIHGKIAVDNRENSSSSALSSSQLNAMPTICTLWWRTQESSYGATSIDIGQ
jgi:hypothetical protein